MKIRLARGLKPNSGAVRFEANQTESWTKVELTEIAVRAEAPRAELLLGPGKHLPEPSGSAECAGLRFIDI